ncbi:hypothetical protein [Acetobacter sp. P5B1]|uniref:hypothetical protein n=1 Tax=Acetobacter sp. P5B1 TaxID=2762620 RepID=UPI001C042104|nr:hypothetical protein [Acetobacter sp. P5B1]
MSAFSYSPTIYRISYVYDVIAGIGLTTPWTYKLLYGIILQLNDGIFGTNSSLVADDPGGIFFANIGGLALCAWAWARALHYTPSNLWIDGGLKLLIVAMQIIAVANGAPTILLALGSVLFVIGAAELVTFRRHYSSAKVG